jgi:hypothetical protein
MSGKQNFILVIVLDGLVLHKSGAVLNISVSSSFAFETGIFISFVYSLNVMAVV